MLKLLFVRKILITSSRKFPYHAARLLQIIWTAVILFCLLLQTFLECVRLRTFSRYGLQQIQVDTHYLQLYLWRFVADEK